MTCSRELLAASDILYPAIDRAMADLGGLRFEGDEVELRLTLEDAIEEFLPTGLFAE